MDKIVNWAEANPLYAGLITFGVGILVLWWMGVFGGSGTAADQTAAAAQQTQAQLATAYYAAEAAQATAGTQLQLATVQADAATNIAMANDNAAVQANNANNQTAQLGYTVGGQVQTTNANDALNAANTAALYNYQTAVATGQAANFNSLLTTTIPYELALTGNQNLYGNFAGTTYGLNSFGHGGGMLVPSPYYPAPVY